MSNIPSIVTSRFADAVPKFKKILQRAKERDVNEADTVTIITDMLEEVFGFDKYSDITREFTVQNTYCDLAVKTSKRIEYLIEAKAIGLELNSKHLKQAVNYAAREGIKWVVLTNGRQWNIHRVILVPKVQNELLFSINFTDIDIKHRETQEFLFLLCKRGVQKDLIGEYYEYRQCVNKYTIGALLSTDEVTSSIRKVLRKLKPGIKVDIDDISQIIETEVIKREVLESEQGISAEKEVLKFINKQKREKQKRVVETPAPEQVKQEVANTVTTECSDSF